MVFAKNTTAAATVQEVGKEESWAAATSWKERETRGDPKQRDQIEESRHAPSTTIYHHLDASKRLLVGCCAVPPLPVVEVILVLDRRVAYVSPHHRGWHLRRVGWILVQRRCSVTTT